MFVLSDASRAKLDGVHRDLITIVESASRHSSVMFSVGEGRRTMARQRQLVASGKSKTMHSRHITGHAVDLYAVVDGEISWDFDLYFEIATAVQFAASKLVASVVWGGCWESLASVSDLSQAVEAYKHRCRKSGKDALLDGVHFELSRAFYP